MLKGWGLSGNTIAVASTQAKMIVIDSQWVSKLNLTQPQLNFLILHEIGHAGKYRGTEKGADRSAVGMSIYYKIPIDKWD